MNQIMSDRLALTKTRLAAYIQAEAAILGGAQSYSIGNRTLTRADLGIIADYITRLQMDLNKLTRGGALRIQRIVPRMP